jgi:DNA-binding NtrC family response regulator
MEPTILLIGRRQEVVNILIDELKKFGRDIEGVSELENIEKILQVRHFDFVVIGAGLPDHQLDFITSFIETVKPKLPVYMIERKAKSKPHKLINFTNRKAIDFKIEQVSRKNEQAE